LALLGSFFVGAFVASMIVESSFFGRTANAYGVALLGEGALLVAFMALSRVAFISAAMGMQNSLVTRVSGAVVRTTHLTGVFTDLGIEGARWFRRWRADVAARLGIPLTFGRSTVERPATAKVLLLSTIAAMFVLGAIFGAFAVVKVSRAAIVVPSAAVFACAAYAFVTARRP